MARDFTAEAVEKISDLIRAGNAPWQKPWKAGERFRPHNPTSGKDYRGFNSIWLQAQGYTDQRWMTYRQATANDAQVRKGEGGTLIEYWSWNSQQKVTDERGNVLTDADGKALTRTVEHTRPQVIRAVVFNAEQIDGLPPQELRPLDAQWERHLRAEAIIAASPAAIRMVRGDGAYYEPRADRITLPERTQFESADRFYATALHEIGHSTGHPDRLDRDLSHPFGSMGYAREELTAEFTSLFLGDALGLGHDPGQHAAYIEGWLKVIKDDPRALMKAAAEAEKALEMVLGYEKTLGLDLGAVKELGISPETSGHYSAHHLVEFHQVGADLGVSADDRNALLSGISILNEIYSDPERRETNPGWRTAAFDAALTDVARLGAASPGHALLASYHAGETMQEAGVSAEWLIGPDAATRQWDDRAREFRVSGVMQALQRPPSNVLQDEISRWEFDDLGKELGLTARDINTARHLLGHITEHVAVVFDHGIDVADVPGVAVALDDLKSFAERSDGHMTIASEIIARVIPDGSDQIGRPVWMMAPEDLNEAVLDVHYKLQAREQAETSINPMAAWERRGELLADASIDPDDIESIMAKEQGRAVEPATTRVNLEVPYREKNEAKDLGAKWDSKGKTWYAPAGTDLEPLSRWRVEGVAVGAEQTPHEEFSAALEAYGFILKGHKVEMDGKFYRVRVDGDEPHEKSGAYKAFDRDSDPKGQPGAFIQNFRTGKRTNWKASVQVEALSPAEAAERRAEAAARRAERDAESEAAYQNAADQVLGMILVAGFAQADNRYLQKKDIGAEGVLQMKEAMAFPPLAPAEEQQAFGGPDHLLIPAHDMKGRVWTAQAIRPDGQKSFPKGARLQGTHHMIGNPEGEGPILIAEGYATGKDLHERTGLPVAVAFNANNLPVVALQFREQYPDRSLVIAGDNDHKKEQEIDKQTGKPKENVGKVKAEAAAEAVNGHALLPQFEPGDKGSDWNDLRKVRGPDEQARQLTEGLAIAERRHMGMSLTRAQDAGRATPDRAKEVEKVVPRESVREPAMGMSR